AQVQQDTESDSRLAPLVASEAAYLLLAEPAERERWKTTPHALAARALAADAVDRIRVPTPGGWQPLQGSQAEQEAFDRGLSAALHRQADFLRDLFASPFQLLAFELAWLTWGGGVVPNLAQSIYDENAYRRLPILADAIEEASCKDENLLGHL